jgi:DNA-binding GntR family transcriptional regulator
MTTNGGGMASLEPFVRRTATEVAVENLRRAIIHGELRGGTRLLQQDIARELNLSTTPVREALRVLAAEGLIEFDPHRGAVVRDVNAEEMREVVWLRGLLEPECMRLATANADAEVLDRAEQLADGMNVETDVARWTTMNREFHTMLCAASGSPWLVSLLASLRAASATYVAATLRVVPEPMEPGNRDHRDLLDAMRRKDADEAAKIALRHTHALFDSVSDPQAQPQ